MQSVLFVQDISDFIAHNTTAAMPPKRRKPKPKKRKAHSTNDNKDPEDKCLQDSIVNNLSQNENPQVEVQPTDNVIKAVATNTTALAAAMTRTAIFLPLTTTTTENPLDLDTSSDSDISLKDCLKADFNLVTIDKHDNPTGMLGRPWAELNAKDEM